MLGIGNIGKLLAHSLARKPCPPLITLLLHRSDMADQYEKAGQSIELVTNGVSDKQFSFCIEVLVNECDTSTSPRKTIQNLIVATKAANTISALARIKNRLNQRSTILFTQNGMGK